MKIAVLSFTSGQVDRGVETIVREVVKRWEGQHQVKVMTYHKVKWLELGSGNFLGRVLMIDKFHRSVFKASVEVIKKLKKWQPDIVMPVNGGWQSLLVKLYCLKHNKKIVIPGLAGLGWCDRWNLLMQPDVFVASTKRNANWARGYNKRVRIEIIPHGVDLNRFKPEGIKRRVSLKKPIVLCVAGHDKYKRVEATVRAVVKLKKASLLLVGGNDEVERLGKKLLGERFLRLQVKYNELDQVYRAVQVFTMVSESSEEFGIVNIEALAMGLPVVATDDELRREILGEYGIYVKDVWGKEYTDKLRQALKRQKHRPDNWLKQFDWDRVAEKYVKLFEDLI